MANAFRGKGQAPAKIEDFMPQYGGPVEVDPEELEKKILGWAKSQDAHKGNRGGRRKGKIGG